LKLASKAMSFNVVVRYTDRHTRLTYHRMVSKERHTKAQCWMCLWITLIVSLAWQCESTGDIGRS